MASPRILAPNGKPFDSPSRALPSVRGRYDAAQTTVENTRHWSAADSLSATAAHSPDVRRKLRERARYEIANNTYAKGIVETRANDLIGTGPRLQIATNDEQLNRRIAGEFESWSSATGFAEKLRTLAKAKMGDGEVFAILANNPRSPSRIQLDVKLVEADQCSSPYLRFDVPSDNDGIQYDQFGNPIEYTFLSQHPGDRLSYGFFDYEVLPASAVIHWFRCDRPGQTRGVPEITSALPLFAQLRRYTLAVIAAAETAADFAAVLYSDLSPDGETADAEPFESLEIERRMMTTLPAGWKMGQFRAEQPATNYEMFKREILNEIARCLNMPYNVAAGNSSGYNYASGRLDHQVYFRSLAVDQYHLETAALDRVLASWLKEAALLGLLPDGSVPPHSWFWDGNEHVDPAKEASAQETRLANHTTTLADEWARRGHDWREKLEQRAKELELMEALGLSVASSGPSSQSTGLNESDDETQSNPAGE